MQGYTFLISRGERSGIRTHDTSSYCWANKYAPDYLPAIDDGYLDLIPRQTGHQWIVYLDDFGFADQMLDGNNRNLDLLKALLLDRTALNYT